MAEITVKTKALEDAISQLKTLKDTCLNHDTKSPSTVGGGLTVNELESMADLYKSINTHFLELVANTISFMENVEASYISSDQKAASSMK